MLLGGLGHVTGGGGFDAFARFVQPLGALWLSGLQAIVLPLIMTQMVLAVADTPADVGVARLGRRALVLLPTLLVAAGVAGVVATPSITAAVTSALRLDLAALAMPAGSVAIPEAARVATATAMRGGDWIAGLIAPNLFQAASEGRVLPVLLAFLAGGAALRRVAPDRRDAVLRVVRGGHAALLQVTGWLLRCTPIGVFAFAYAAALQTGGNPARMLGAYVLVICVALTLGALPIYLLATLGGRVPPRTFARAVAPAQLVALGTRSSLAALPALMRSADDVLRLPPVASGVVLPLCTALLKVSSPLSSAVTLVFLAAVYDVRLDTPAIGTFLGVVTLLSIGVAGIPGGGNTFTRLPVFVAAGIPVEGVVLVELVDAIPDAFKSAFNATANLAVATVLAPSGPGSDTGTVDVAGVEVAT
jgi:Na+/H+-dicarboxylate symporter